MPDDHRLLAELKVCMRGCNGNAQCLADCEQTFKDAGGTVEPDGGKVFTAPDGSTAFVTHGGKVFSGTA